VDEHAIRFMQHALTLARKGIGLASPNPTVGCVIVREGQIVGEGFHQYESRDHVEIAALKLAGEKAHGATLYVTLEPCNHTGRTGPCTEAIIAAGVQRVVAAMDDPSPLNSGRGFERLRAAGVEIITGVGEEEARYLNEAFAWWIRTKRPFVTLKSALTLDGQLALPHPRKKYAAKSEKRRAFEWITSEESRAEVHRMRHASDALLTGIGTILADNPLLTDRSGLPRRKRLLRVVLDSKLRLSPKSRIVETSDDDLLVFTAAPLTSPRARRLDRIGVELFHLEPCGRKSFLLRVFRELGRREILSVLLEAGPTLNGTALSAGWVHKLALFVAPKLAGNSAVPFADQPSYTLPALRMLSFQRFGPDLFIEASFPEAYRK